MMLELRTAWNPGKAGEGWHRLTPIEGLDAAPETEEVVDLGEAMDFEIQRNTN